MWPAYNICSDNMSIIILINLCVTFWNYIFFSSNLTSSPGKLTFWQIQFLVVITVIFVVIEVGLWMAVGVVVSREYPNGSK